MSKEAPRMFMSVRAYRGQYETADGAQPLILEQRLLPDGEMRVFTVLAGQPVRARSIQALMLERPEWVALRLAHTVDVLWKGRRHLAELEEAYLRAPGFSAHLAVALCLRIGGEVVATELCDTLSEALAELQALGAAGGGYRPVICHSCALSRPSLTAPGWDDRDDHQCFRDTPEAYASIGGDGRPVRGWGLHGGDYFVNAFHTCAAWRQAMLQRPPGEE